MVRFAAAPPSTPYRNPLRAASVTTGRIDQGEDFSGSGPVYAFGPGDIELTTNSGWPGGGDIIEHLTAGPDAGQWVYVAEDISPAVAIGQHVTAGTVLGQMNGGIEIGFAAPPPNLGNSLARQLGQGFPAGPSGPYDNQPTPEGRRMAGLLSSLGVANGAPANAGAAAPSSTTAGVSGLPSLLILIPFVAAGAGLALWGVARATGASSHIKSAAQNTAGAAAKAGAIAAL